MYCNRPNPTEDDRQKILNLQQKLDEVHSRKAQGGFIRSRAKWIEEGETIQRISVVLKKEDRKKIASDP